MVGKKLLRHRDVDLSLGLLHHLFPASMPGIRRGRGIVWIKCRLVFDHFGIACKVRTDKVSILGSPQRSILQAEFEISYLTGLAIADQPVVGIAAVVAFFDNPYIVVNT